MAEIDPRAQVELLDAVRHLRDVARRVETVLENPLLIGDDHEELRRLGEWPSLDCENPMHRQRQFEDHHCPDCGSTWWSIHGDPGPIWGHLAAALHQALAPFPRRP